MRGNGAGKPWSQNCGLSGAIASGRVRTILPCVVAWTELHFKILAKSTGPGSRSRDGSTSSATTATQSP